LIGLVVNMLDPEAIVLGGGLGLAAGPYRDG
jgi:predicted NBD/HSP70 family sugar kinase